MYEETSEEEDDDEITELEISESDDLEDQEVNLTEIESSGISESPSNYKRLEGRKAKKKRKDKHRGTSASRSKRALQVSCVLIVILCLSLTISLIVEAVDFGNEEETSTSGGLATFSFNIIFVFFYMIFTLIITRGRIWNEREIPAPEVAIALIFSLITLLLGIDPDFYGTASTVFAWLLTVTLWLFCGLSSGSTKEWCSSMFQK